MSTLSRLRLSGVRSFDPDEEQEIKFQSPVTLFLGQNGCGKTSIIESIKYAITGELPLGTKNGQGFIHDPQMCHKTESRAQIKLKIYDVRGLPFTIQKVAKVTQTYNGLKFQSMNATITRNNDSTSNRCLDVQQEVCRSMGVSKAILNNVIFCHQEDSYWPLEEPKKLKERFDKIFDSAKYNYCIDKVQKLKKEMQTKLKILSVEVDVKKTNKEQVEKKKELLREKRERESEMLNRMKKIGEEVKPIQERLESTIQVEQELNKLQTKIESLKSQINLNKSQQREILSSIRELDWTDTELQNKIDSFQTNTDKIQSEIDEFESEKRKIERQEEQVRMDQSKEQLNLGRLKEELKQHKKNIEDQKTLINTLQTDYDITLSPSLENSKNIKVLETKLNEIEEKITDLEKSNEISEKENQDNIDSCRTKLVQLEQEVTNKNKQIEELQKEDAKVKRTLSELDTYDDQLKSVEIRLHRSETDLKTLESQLDVTKLKEEIENEKEKYEDIDEKLQKIDKEIQTLQSYASVQTELDLHQENLMAKNKSKRELYYKHETALEEIFDYSIPTENLRDSLTVILKKQTAKITQTNEKISRKEREVNSIESALNTQKDKLRQLKLELIENKEEINSVYKGKTFEEVERSIKETIDDLQTQKGEYLNSVQMYRKFIQSFRKEKPCCPVCNRDVPERTVSSQIVEEIEKKIGDFPKLAEQTEARLKKELETQSKILELKPKYYRTIDIEKNELPLLKKRVLDQENNYREIKDELENLKKSILEPQVIQEKINGLITDIALIDSYNIDIKKLQNEISDLKSKIPSTQSNRSIQEAYSEQENLKSLFKETRQKIESLTEKLNKHNERLQKLRDERNDLKNKELQMKQGLSEKEHLEIKTREINKKLTELTTEVDSSRKAIKPLKENLEKAIKSKDISKRVFKQKREELGNIHKCFEKILKEIKTLQDKIDIGDRKNIEEKVETVSGVLEGYETDLLTFTKKKENILKQIEGLKDQIVNKKAYYRELLDNKRLREKRVELAELTEEFNELEKQTTEQDAIKLLHARQKIEKKLIEFSNELSQLKGTVSEVKNSISESEKELTQPIYKNAHLEYKKKFIEKSVLEHSVKDLEVFVKAVDWAMVQYHKQQMVYINETIRDLWRSIYRGNDIDYIEIKTEIQNQKNTTGTRRVYQYSLVQVKNDVKIEMRGRCSAGQKVLASLVIRIALADTFSTKCGILALDEPTTNLDKENISSLCEALCDLINRKRNQKSFQLLIITHDQEFLEKLSRTVLMEHYVHVYRNEYGKSIVELKPCNF